MAPRWIARKPQQTGDNTVASVVIGSPLRGMIAPPRMICGISTYGSRALARSGVATHADSSNPSATPVIDSSTSTP